MMLLDEFSIIRKYFQHQPVQRQDVILGSGDDCALVSSPVNQALALSIDTLIAGVHFPEQTPPYDIAYKALAVNLSDLAAMGAEPAWFTCALTLPEVDYAWLNDFAAGLFALAQRFNLQLVGGDLTCGHLSITIQVHGFVPAHLALRRDNAKAGDAIYVSGTLGAAAYVLQQLQRSQPVPQHLLNYLYRPEPQIDLGLALRGKAHSAIDISDGLVADLGHVLKASNVGAGIYLEKIPVHPILQNNYQLALTAGDDYQLCFTAPAALKLNLTHITCIGQIEKPTGLRIYQPDGTLVTPAKTGYQHFSATPPH